jgi:hypothetical protein
MTIRSLLVALLVVAGCKDKAREAPPPSTPSAIPLPPPPKAPALARATAVRPLPDGPFTLTSATGARLEGAFEKGKREGKWTSWYSAPDGGAEVSAEGKRLQEQVKAAEFHYAQGVREGEFATWAPDGADWLRGTCAGGKCKATSTQALGLLSAPMELAGALPVVETLYGRQLVVVDDTGKVFVSVNQGFKELVQLPGKAIEPPVGLPDNRLAFRTAGGLARVVDGATGNVLQELEGVTAPLSRVQYFGAASSALVPKRPADVSTLLITELGPAYSVTKVCLPGASPTARMITSL